MDLFITIKINIFFLHKFYHKHEYIFFSLSMIVIHFSYYFFYSILPVLILFIHTTLMAFPSFFSLSMPSNIETCSQHHKCYFTTQHFLFSLFLFELLRESQFLFHFSSWSFLCFWYFIKHERTHPSNSVMWVLFKFTFLTPQAGQA